MKLELDATLQQMGSLTSVIQKPKGALGAETEPEVLRLNTITHVLTIHIKHLLLVARMVTFSLTFSLTFFLIMRHQNLSSTITGVNKLKSSQVLKVKRLVRSFHLTLYMLVFGELVLPWTFSVALTMWRCHFTFFQRVRGLRFGLYLMSRCIDRPFTPLFLFTLVYKRVTANY